MTIPSIDSFSNYNKYKSEAGYTKQADMMRYLANQNDCLTALTQALLWQPETAYEVGKVIQSPTMPTGVRARVTQAGTSGQAEPAWTDAGTTVTDGTITYTMESLDYAALIAAATSSLQETMTEAIATAKNAMDFNMLKRNKAYSIGDIAYSSYLPSWARLECVTAGTTAGTVPSSITIVSSGGVLISDGTVTWIVDDIRDMTPAGCVRGSLFLPKGYIKANGATVQRADYPRLVHFIESNNLWTDDITTNAGLFGKGDGSSTFVLPDYRERIMQYTEGSIGAKRDAGIPNLKGYFNSFQGTFAPIENQDFSHPFKAGFTGNYPLFATTTEVRTSMSGLWFDASTVSPVYNSSNTVQPPAINVIPIIRY